MWLMLLSNTAILNPLLLSNTDSMVRTFWKYQILQFFPLHTRTKAAPALYIHPETIQRWGFGFYQAGSV